MRKLPNGDIVFPKKGDPPPCPDGYYRDKGNPFLFHLDVPDCPHREMKTYVKPCGKLGCYMMCNHFAKEVNSVVCNDCPIPD
jgi:Rad3-related DNA helicase